MSNVLALKQDQVDLPPSTTSASLILSGDAMERVFKFAEMMAKGTATVPRHLQGNTSDCLAVVMQATQWGMNPFAVAQKTHVTQGGALGYEAQLISAVITANAPVTGAPDYEYIGDWSKVLGKVVEKEGKSGGKYYAATYTKADEDGLGIICRMTLKGESKPRELMVMMSQCYPRFSTQWANDPKQQISYVAIRKWGRLYAPGVILGVYAPDELQEVPESRFMGQADVVMETVDVRSYIDGARATKTDADAAAYWKEHNAKFAKQLADHQALKDAVIAHRKSMKEANTVENTAKPAAPAPADAPVVTYAVVMEKMVKAKNLDALYVAADWIGEVEDPAQRSELSEKFEEFKATLEAA